MKKAIIWRWVKRMFAAVVTLAALYLAPLLIPEIILSNMRRGDAVCVSLAVVYALYCYLYSVVWRPALGRGVDRTVSAPAQANKEASGLYRGLINHDVSDRTVWL